MVHPGRFASGLCRLVGPMIAQASCLVALATVALAADLPANSVRANQVADHLAAGEFGPAMTQALAAPTPGERTELLKQVADAQQASGEGEAASGTLRRVPRGEDREKARTEQGRLSGGGARADFQTLMRLIMQNTPGKWEDSDGEGGTMSPFPTGVKVSPNGLLHRLSGEEHAGQLTAMGVKARNADLNDEISQQSSLRMVSLSRLERCVAQRIEEGLPVPESMAQLAGLSRIKYVLVYPEANEIVVAGPAGGWTYDNQGHAVSHNDGRPTLQLDDLVTVLRTFARGEADFGCSINTREEGVRALQAFVQKSQARGPISDKAVGGWVKQLQQKLGHQDVVVWGVPADSRVARVIVEADYRMKLIGINKLDAGKDIPSYFDLLPVSEQTNANLDALRWWLTMQFDGVAHSADKNVFEIQGSSVLCQSENQLLTAEGKHLPTGKSEATNRQFARNFTANYAKLAKKDLVFADMQNIFDMALCSALIQHEQLNNKVGWNFGVFAPGGSYAPATYAVPKEIESVVNHKVYRGKDIVVQAAGGVRGDLMSVVKDPNLSKTAATLENVADVSKAPQLPVGRWWWDVAN